MTPQMCLKVSDPPRLLFHYTDDPLCRSANKKGLLTDLMVKAKQLEYLINSLPELESEEEQVGSRRSSQFDFSLTFIHQSGDEISTIRRGDDACQ